MIIYSVLPLFLLLIVLSVFHASGIYLAQEQKRQLFAAPINCMLYHQDIIVVIFKVIKINIQWNLSYPGDVVPTAVRISEMSVTKNQALK